MKTESENGVMVFKTQNDYSKLNNLPFNRKVLYRHDLENKIKKYGFVGAILIIYTDLVDGEFKWYILDGQHRALIASTLGIEFRAIVVENKFKSLDELVQFIATLNVTQQRWLPYDYASAYAQLQYPEYKRLMEITSKCRFSITTVANMLHGVRTRGNVKRAIENGTFKATYLESTKATIAYAQKLHTEERPMTNRMILALHYLRSQPIWNEKKFTVMYEHHYNDGKGKGLDDYTDLFIDWLS